MACLAPIVIVDLIETSMKERRDAIGPMPHDTLIGLGTNLGDREANLRVAIRRLEDDPDVRVLALSPVYRSKPMGPALHEFLNAVVRIETDLDPGSLLARLQACEREAGRPEDHERWGPRVLDLDILTMGDLVRDDPPPVLPHPGMLERDFVLRPCVDLVPALDLPGAGGRLVDALPRLADRTLIGDGSPLPARVEYELLEHTADAGLALAAPGLESLYERACMALSDAIVPRAGRRETAAVEVSKDAPDRESLLVDLLGEVVYLMDARTILPVRASLRLDDGERPAVRGTFYCSPFDPADVRAAPKAVTHHRVRVAGGDDGFDARFYLDL
jgi:2-amino-4-hydroxy-6-hydroxymethyldihydropteridine diphosphokinase